MTLKRETGIQNSNNGFKDKNSTSDDDKSQRSQTSRVKRQSNSHEPNLPNIQETEESSRVQEGEEDDSVFEETAVVRKSRWATSSFSVFQTEIEQEQSESGQSSKSSVGLERTQEKTRTIEETLFKSEQNRGKSESRIAHAGDVESVKTTETNRTKTTLHTRLHSCSESSKSSLFSIPKLDVRNSGSEGVKSSDNPEDGHSCHSTGKKSTASSEVKLPQVQCVHHGENNRHGRVERISKTVKFKAENENCRLCEGADDAARNAQVEANRLLLDIVYPHEFYDKFSRARHSRKASTNQVVQKEAISICKPAKVVRKVNQSEKTWNRLPQSTVKVSEESGLLQYSNVPEKRRREEHAEETDTVKKDIHVQCKPKTNALVITDDMRGQEMVLRGLKGWLLRKHDECKNITHREMKQSLYQVSTLGMKFGLPEYNNALHDRKPTSPRPVTCLTSRSQDNGLTLRPSTHNLGPRQRTMPILTRDMLSGQSRSFVGLQRDLTTLPNRLPTAPQESSAKNNIPVHGLNPLPISSPKHLENAIAKVMKAGLSLPPISTDVKSSSVALGHTQT